MTAIIVTGTDTGIGKTVLSAALVHALGASYWKPVQSGLEEGTDSELVARLSGASSDRILPEGYRLAEPLSPHLSARRMGVVIESERLALPHVDGPLVVEGAGGLLVPLRPDLVFADLFARWAAPVVLVARTALGTINHSLLTIEALRRRNIAILGIAFVGEPNEESEDTIVDMGGVKYLGRLPLLDRLDSSSLAQAFEAHFRVEDFRT